MLAYQNRLLIKSSAFCSILVVKKTVPNGEENHCFNRSSQCDL